MAPVTLPGTAGPCDGKARAILLERSKRRDSAPREGTSEGGGLARWPCCLAHDGLGGGGSLGLSFLQNGKTAPTLRDPREGPGTRSARQTGVGCSRCHPVAAS